MTDPIRQRVERLIDALAEKTEANQVDWQTTDEETAFVAAMEAGTVIVRSVDRDGIAPFEVRVLNRDGVIVEAVTNLELSEASATRLATLYELARRQSLAVDETLDGLLGELDT